MNLVTLFSKKDIFKVLTEKIDGLDLGYRRAVIFGFLTCLVAYGFQLTHVVMSPDMFNEVVTGHNYPINFSGRWFMAFVRNVLLSENRIVPTFNLLISITLFICSSLFIVKMWRISRPLYVYIVISIITANTYTCHILRWENAHLEASITTFIAVLSLYLSGRGLKMFLPALVLMACAHGGYQTGVALACVAMFAGFALWLFQDGDLRNFYLYLKTKIIPALCVFSGGFFLHKLILMILMRYMDLQAGMRLENTHIPKNIGELIDNINLAIISIPSIFSHQVLYLSYQINLLYKIFFILLTVSLVIFFLKKKSFERLFIILLVCIFSYLSLISTYLPTIAVGYGWISNRILFPVAVFHSFIAIFVLLSKSIIIRNISIISCFCLIFLFAWHNNIYAYRSFVQDRADFELASRIITRIESLPAYEEYSGATLKIWRIGTKDLATPGYRFTATPNIKVRTEGAFSQTWSADGIFRYLHFPHTSSWNIDYAGQAVSSEMAETILQMEEWPSPKSVAIVDGIAILMLDKSKIPNNVIQALFTSVSQNNEIEILPDSQNLKVTNHISSYYPDGNFIVSGNDPTMSFSVRVPNKDNKYIVRIRIDVPSTTMVQIFYKPDPSLSYSEHNSIKYTADKGQNECYFILDGNAFNGDLRFDPGTFPGEYKLNDIVVREIMPTIELNNLY